MSTHRLLTSPTRTTDWVDDGDKVHFVTKNTEAFKQNLLKQAEIDRQSFASKGKYGEMQHVTRLMPSEVDVLKEKGILGPNLQIQDEAALNRFIRDPDRRLLLTVPHTY